MQTFHISETLKSLAGNVGLAVWLMPRVALFMAERLPADRTFNHAGQPVLCVRHRMLIAPLELLAASAAILYEFPGSRINNRFVVTVADYPFLGIAKRAGAAGDTHIVSDFPNIKWIIQHIDNSLLVKFLSRAGNETVSIEISCNRGDVISGSIHVKDPSHNSGFLLFNLGIFAGDLGIPEGHFPII